MEANFSDTEASDDEPTDTAATGEPVTVQDKDSITKKMQQRGPNWKVGELQLLTDQVLGNMDLLSGELSYTDEITSTCRQAKW